jgi:hypothetical protein
MDKFSTVYYIGPNRVFDNSILNLRGADRQLQNQNQNQRKRKNCSCKYQGVIFQGKNKQIIGYFKPTDGETIKKHFMIRHLLVCGMIN